MLNFENLDGFIVDMRADGDCNTILEDILCEDSDLCDVMQHAPLDVKRAYITEYFTSTYNYVFTKRPHVLQVCEETLYTYDDVHDMREIMNRQATDIIELYAKINDLRALNEQGLQYATSRDNKIEELESFIGEQAVQLLKQEDQINNLIDKYSSLKLENDEYSRKLSVAHNTICMLTDKLDKIKEIINNER